VVKKLFRRWLRGHLHADVARKDVVVSAVLTIGTMAGIYPQAPETKVFCFFSSEKKAFHLFIQNRCNPLAIRAATLRTAAVPAANVMRKRVLPHHPFCPGRCRHQEGGLDSQRF